MPTSSIIYEWTKNSPIYQTQEELDGNYTTYLIGFRHYLNENWVMELSCHFRSFIRDQTDRELSFFSVNHSTLRLIRLYHPTYLLLGPKMSYLMPTLRSRFPLTKDPKLDTEMGASLSLQLYHQLGETVAITFRVDRWRGTGTNKFHGFETAFGIGYTLK